MVTDGSAEAGGPTLRRDIVVIGASGEGIETLARVVSELPAELPATLLVTAPFLGNSSGRLPAILSRAALLPAVHVWGREPIRHGIIYVAPPDFHLTLTDGEASAVHGPREGGYRPAVDPLFRSAALEYGERVVGVVLAGTLDHGTSGLQAIKQLGGVAVVQDPREATVPAMPRHAIDNVAVDFVLPASEIAPLLVRLAGPPPRAPFASPAVVPRPGPAHRGPGGYRIGAAESRADMELEVALERLEPRALEEGARVGAPSRYRCPDCGGVLREAPDSERRSNATPTGGIIRFRCGLGHGWSGPSLELGEALLAERHLWEALNSFDERASLARRLADQADARGHTGAAERYRARAARADVRAHNVRHMLGEEWWDLDPVQED